jgi:transposase-like protein
VIQRGLKRFLLLLLLLLVSDDFRGLKEAIKILFPCTCHQLSLIHLIPSLRRHLKKEDAQRFNKELQKIKLCHDFSQGIDEFSRLCNI